VAFSQYEDVMDRNIFLFRGCNAQFLNMLVAGPQPSSTFHLNGSVFCGIGGAFKWCLCVVYVLFWGCLGGVRGYRGCLGCIIVGSGSG